MGSFVEGFCYVAKSFLPGRVPDVEGQGLPIMLDALDLEVHANGTQVVSLEGIVAVTDQQTGFAHATVPHHQVFQGYAFRFRHLLCYY